jgi:hypothetical protein
MTMSTAHLRALILPVLIAAAVLSGQAFAQGRPLPQGDFNGQLGPLTVILHLSKSADGTLAGTLDSPNQGANGLVCADFHLDGTALSFRVPVVNGSWTGTVSADGATLTGTWSQGTPAPLVFARDTFVPAANYRQWTESGWARCRGRSPCAFKSWSEAAVKANSSVPPTASI